MSWSIYNSYILNHIINTRLPMHTSKTVYQQLWTGKKYCRGYHDANITERQWKKLFLSNPRLPAVASSLSRFVNTGKQPLYTDGTATHKGTGKSELLTPAAMLFAPLEARLDFVLFRSHFVSSVLEAHYLIKSRMVKVNGKDVHPLLIYFGDL